MHVTHRYSLDYIIQNTQTYHIKFVILPSVCPILIRVNLNMTSRAIKSYLRTKKITIKIRSRQTKVSISNNNRHIYCLKKINTFPISKLKFDTIKNLHNIKPFVRTPRKHIRFGNERVVWKVKKHGHSWRALKPFSFSSFISKNIYTWGKVRATDDYRGSFKNSHLEFFRGLWDVD